MSKLKTNKLIYAQMISNLNMAQKKNAEHIISRKYHAPMHQDPTLFDVASALPIGIAKQALNKYSNKLGILLQDLKIKGKVLDVGCGQGAVSKYMMRYFEKSSTLDAFDMSEGIVQYARTHYADEKIKYFTMNAAKEVPDDMECCYDLVTCISVLHWAMERRKIVANISKMLKPNKNSLFVMFHYNSVFSAWREVAKIPKWASYCQDVESLISPYQDISNADDHLKRMMMESGFKHADVSLEEYEDMHQENKLDLNCFRGILKGVNPFVPRLPTIEDQNIYMEDMVTALVNIGGFKNLDNLANYDGRALELNFTLIVAIGSN